MTMSHSSDPRRLRITSATGLALLVAVQTPQSIIQAGGGARLESEYGAALAIGAAVLAAVWIGYRMLAKLLPRTSDHQLVARYLSEPVSIIVASAKLVAYVLVVALAAGFALNALAPLIDYGSIDVSLLHAGALLLLAIPTLAGWRMSARILMGMLVPAAAAIAVIIVGGLIIELVGGLTTLPKSGAIDSPAGVRWPLGEAVLGACLPAALLGLVTERGFGEGTTRRVVHRNLLKLLVPVIVSIAALMYLADVVSLSARTQSPSIIALAEVFFPDPVVAIIAVAFCLAGIAIGLAASTQVISLLRMLGADGILPRYVVAADAYGSRRIVFAAIVVACAAAVYGVSSPLRGARMATAIMFVSFLLVMIAGLARARSLKRRSTDVDEREAGRRSTRLALIIGLLVLLLLVASALVQPLFTGVGLVVLGVPAAALLILRRGMGKIGARLAASDLSAGRTLPTRVHAIVLVERLDRPTLQAISYVRATRPSTMTGLVVDVDPEVTEALTADWTAAELPVELRILGVPRGAARMPVIDHVRSLRRTAPRDIVIIYAPRVVSQSAIWQRFFVRHSTPALLSELKLEPGVIVAEVPYQIEDIEEQ